jgi:multidrug efflux system membrane fusion protein
MLGNANNIKLYEGKFSEMYMKPYTQKSRILFVFLIFLLAAFYACGQKASQNSPATRRKGALDSTQKGRNVPAVPVSVAKVVKEDVPVQISAIGTVEAYSTVEIRTQVGGILDSVHFKEGQEVKKGDILFTIDKRPYEALLHKEEANLKSDMVEEKNAREIYDRLAVLAQKKFESQENVDNARATAEAKKMQLDVDKASVEYARLQLEYCTIYATVDGVTGNLMVNAGNLVKVNDTLLVTINQIRPIYVTFSVPEQNLSTIRQYMQSNQKLSVQGRAPGDESKQETGELVFVDNQIDRNTGTIKLKASFDNSDKALWPGQYVNVALKLTTQANALVVPVEAVQTGQNGQYVYVVRPDNIVENREVKQGRIFDDKAVVENGVAEGETIVTDGQLRLSPGSRVEIKNLNSKPD